MATETYVSGRFRVRERRRRSLAGRLARMTFPVAAWPHASLTLALCLAGFWGTGG